MHRPTVVPPNGPEPLNLPTFAAIPRVLRALCGAGACARITRHPVADIAKLVRRIGGSAVSGRWIDGDGRPHTLHISSEELLGVLIAGDLEPVLRAEFPAAVRSAVSGDTAPFARLLRDAAERGEDAEAESPSESFDSPLYFTTSCEEELFPWRRTSTPGKRLAEARAQIRGLPASRFAPFARGEALGISDIPECAFWPYTSPTPAPVQTPLPSVPTLILSGAEDLRTPTANAREVAAQIPGSHLLVVPEVGHSVLGSDFSGCASKALQALFKSAPIKPCTGGTQLLNLLGLAPLAPTHLSEVPPTRGYGGQPGRTLRAVGLTLADLVRQEAVHALDGLLFESDLRVGGLRSGWASATSRALTLRDYSYVPGVTVSGKIAGEETVLRIGGSLAAHGTLRLSAHQTLTGALDGRHVSTGRGLDLAAVSAAIVRMDVQASHPIAPGGSAIRAVAPKLARLLARLS
jgi:hypothetical protein